MMILDVDIKMKKKKGAAFFEREPELTDEWVLSHQAFLVEDQRTKITKKFEKDNEKLVAEKKKPLPEKELKERLKVAVELEKKFKKENKTKKVEAEGKGPTVAKLESNIEKIEERIKNLEAQSADREGNKEVALGTSKIVSPTESSVGCNVLISGRTTSIHGSVLSSLTSSTCRSSGSSRRLSVRSLLGPSPLSVTMTLGSFKSFSAWLSSNHIQYTVRINCRLGRIPGRSPGHPDPDPDLAYSSTTHFLARQLV